jgi:hypothetical protein
VNAKRAPARGLAAAARQSNQPRGYTARRAKRAWTVVCPYCSADVGIDCRTRTGRLADRPHLARARRAVNRTARPSAEVYAELAEERAERLRRLIVDCWIAGDDGRATACAEALWQEMRADPRQHVRR